MSGRAFNCARLAVFVLLLAAPAACSRHGAPSGAPPGEPSGAAGDEGPRIATSADNVHIEYRVYVRGDPAVLLVHGWAGNAHHWSAQIEALKRHGTVVTLDLAGHGASGGNRSDWSIENYAQDVAAVARQIPNAQIVLVGHSMGATVALRAIPLVGPRVIGVIAIEALRSVGTAPLTPAEIERRIAPFSTDFVGATRQLVTGSLFAPNADPALVQKVTHDMSLERPQVAIASLRSLLSLDIEGLLSGVHVPVLAINSDLLPTDAARIRRSLPGFTLDVLDHSDHFLMLEAPARFNPLLLRDLERLAPGSAGH